MAKYLVLIYGDEQVWAAAPQQWHEENSRRHAAFAAEAAGAVLGGAELQPSATATSLRAGSSEELTVTDGPFVETKEAIGGYYLLEAADDAKAIELAGRIPEASGAASGVEVRRIVD
jgi:hypothetical protein